MDGMGALGAGNPTQLPMGNEILICDRRNTTRAQDIQLRGLAYGSVAPRRRRLGCRSLTRPPGQWATGQRARAGELRPPAVAGRLTVGPCYWPAVWLLLTGW